MKVETLYRPIDLARAASVSTATVRVYEREGFLPPVGRRESGHRRYTAIHLHALLTARTMMRGYGWAYARRVMRAVHGGDLAAALTLVDARHAALDKERAEVGATIRAFEIVARDQDDGSRDDGLAGVWAPMRVGEAARWASVDVSALRFWEQQGLLRPHREPRSHYRLYDREQLRLLRLVVVLRGSGYRVEEIGRLMDGLRSGRPDAALAEVRKRRDTLVQASRDCMTATAALSGYLTVVEASRRDQTADGDARDG